MGIGLVIGVWVARYLGPEQFGLLNYVLALVGLFSALAGLGLDNVVVRDIVRGPTRSDETLGTAFVLTLLSGVLTYSFLLVLITVIRPASLTQVLVAMAGVTLVASAFNVVDFWFQARVLSRYTVLARNTSFLMMTAVRVGLLLLAAPLVAFVAAVALEAILAAVGLVIAYRFTGQHIRAWRATRIRARELLLASWPLMLSGLAIGAYMRIDQIMLEAMVGEEAVGLYAAALRVSEIWYFVPIAVASSVAPALIQTKIVDPSLYEHRVQKLLTAMAALGYAVAIPVTLLAQPLISLLYGSPYAGAGSTLAVHIWAGLFVSLGVAQGIWLINENRTKFSLVTAALGAGLNVGLNFILLPRYASLGAAIATLISYGISVVICYIYVPTRSLGKMTFRALLLLR
jgi:PST family polysaccharide transporter